MLKSKDLVGPEIKNTIATNPMDPCDFEHSKITLFDNTAPLF